MPFAQPPLPGPIQINIPPGTKGVDFDHAVYAKQYWGDTQWTLLPHLIAIQATESDINGQSVADFVYDFGRVKQLSDTTIKGYESIVFSRNVTGVRPLRDLFIAIKAIPKDGTQGYCLWCGYMPADQIQLGAQRPTLGVPGFQGAYPLQQGGQTLRAYGFQYLLERRRIRGAIVRKTGADQGGITPAALLSQPNKQPPFNERGPSGRHVLGNRALDRIKVSVQGTTKNASYGFGDSGQKWSALAIIEYALFWSNEHSSDDYRPFMYLDGTADAEDPTLDPLSGSTFNALHYLLSRHDLVETAQEGYDVLGLLRRMIDPRRGVQGQLRWSALDGDQLPKFDSDILLSLSSTADKNTVIGGITHPANPNIFTEDIDSDTNLAIRSVNVEVDASNVYDEVIFQGEPMVVCFSADCGGEIASNNRAPMKPAWTPAEEAAYLTAADANRQSDIYDKVYTTFKLCAPDGVSGFEWKKWDTLTSLLPMFDDQARIITNADGSISGPAGYLNLGKGLLRELPLTNPFDVISELTDSGYVRSFAVVERLDTNGMGTGKWELAHKPAFPGQTGINAILDISAQVTPDDRELQIAVKFTRNHDLARNHFNPNGTTQPASLGGQPRFDYEKMVVTVAIQTDVRPAVVVRPTAMHSTTKVRRLVINVDGAETWWVAPGTVQGIKADGTLNTYGFPGLVRDDTQRLRDVAAMATQMYGKPNISVALTRHGLYDIYSVGSLLKAKTKSTLVNLQRAPNDNSDPKEILSCITARSWDFKAKTISIVTGPINYGTID